MPAVANMIISHGPQMLANSASALKPNAVTSTAAAPKTIARPMKPTLVGYAASWAGKLRIRRRAVAETVIMAAEMIANTTAFSPLRSEERRVGKEGGIGRREGQNKESR